jgi:hypothetical protein
LTRSSLELSGLGDRRKEDIRLKLGCRPALPLEEPGSPSDVRLVRGRSRGIE